MSHPRALIVVLAGIAGLVLALVAAALVLAEERRSYDLMREIFLPLIGPLVAVLIPMVLLYVIPTGQSRERVALDLCAQYYTEEMRVARNVGWEHFVTSQRRSEPEQRAERLNDYLDYLTSPEAHRTIDPKQDEVYQRTTRVLDFFAIVDECLLRGSADPGIVRAFLLYYYLWWRDEILDPLRQTRRILADGPKFRPPWWDGMTQLDRLAK